MKCNTCKNNGFIFYTKVVEEIKYQFIAYCNCTEGLKWRYRGENCKEHKTEFYIENMSQVIAVEEERKKLTKDDVGFLRRFLPANSEVLKQLEEKLKIPDWVVD